MFPLQELVVSDGFSEIKVEIGTSFLFVKSCLNYLLNYWLKYVLYHTCIPSRKRLDVGMLLLSMKTNELSRHILEMRWFTLEIHLSLLLTTTPEMKILLTPANLRFKLICFKLSLRFWKQSRLSSFSRSLTPTCFKAASNFLFFNVSST